MSSYRHVLALGLAASTPSCSVPGGHRDLWLFLGMRARAPCICSISGTVRTKILFAMCLSADRGSRARQNRKVDPVAWH
jgi:hypothetical protein